MLKGSFFTVSETETAEGLLKTLIKFDPGHIIFEGHFPGVPVVPGVCMLQIVKEMLGDAVQKELRLTKADHLKFLTVINPVETGTVKLEISYTSSVEGQFSANASLSNEGITYFKFKGVFSET